jgi:DNA-binding Lrp family transcriptional regulator
MKRDVKPIEYREYTDNQTGEIHTVPVMIHEKGNKDFEMIFYGHFLEILNDLGNGKIRILQHILKNKSKSENVFIGTQRDIAKSLNMSVRTVNETIKLLEDKNAIYTKTGVIYIKADIMCDGRFKDRIMHIYKNAEEKETEEQDEAKIEREIRYQEKQTEILKDILKKKKERKEIELV